MGVNTAQMDGLIVEADMWDVTSLTSMRQWKWLLLNKRAHFLPGVILKVVPRWHRCISVLGDYAEH
jgi:hypothetical protein